MPKMDGFGLVEQLRHRSESSPVTVMMLTSAGHWGDVDLCRSLGIRSYLDKPVRQQELLLAISMALGREQTPSHLAVLQASPRQSLLILLAEDSRINQAVASRMLEKMGHSVIVAANGKEALSLSNPISSTLF
jgi:two-component system, sensor histidine kinase and response regulator